MSNFSPYTTDSVLYGMDRSTLDERDGGPGPWDHLENDEEIPDTIPPVPPRENKEAVPVNQRSASDWSGRTIEVPGTTPSQVGPTKIANRQPGRTSILIFVPSGQTAVYIDSSQSTLSAAGGTPLGALVPAGASISIPTEGPVWALSSGAATLVTVIETWSALT